MAVLGWVGTTRQELHVGLPRGWQGPYQLEYAKKPGVQTASPLLGNSHTRLSLYSSFKGEISSHLAAGRIPLAWGIDREARGKGSLKCHRLSVVSQG